MLFTCIAGKLIFSFVIFFSSGHSYWSYLVTLQCCYHASESDFTFYLVESNQQTELDTVPIFLLLFYAFLLPFCWFCSCCSLLFNIRFSLMNLWLGYNIIIPGSAHNAEFELQFFGWRDKKYNCQLDWDAGYGPSYHPVVVSVQFITTNHLYDVYHDYWFSVTWIFQVSIVSIVKETSSRKIVVFSFIKVVKKKCYSVSGFQPSDIHIACCRWLWIY